MKRKLLNFLLVGTFVLSINSTSILADTHTTDMDNTYTTDMDNTYISDIDDSSYLVPQEDLTGFSPIEEAKRQELLGDNPNVTTTNLSDATRVSQAKPLRLPDGGTLTSNVWRSTNSTTSGNTLQWDYQVSAVYNGNTPVNTIRSTWQGGASLRQSASISLGVNNGGLGSASVSSSWQNVTTTSAFVENTRGQNNASHRSNMIVAPARDYRNDTIYLANTARVELQGYAIPYSITASV